MSDRKPSTLRKSGALTMLVTAVLGSGCASRIAYVRPADPSQTQYIQTPAGMKTSVTGTAEDIPQVSFGDNPPGCLVDTAGIGADQSIGVAGSKEQSIARQR